MDPKCCACRTAEGAHKIKKGWLCEKCFSALPLSLQHSAASFTPEQLRSARSVYRKAYQLPWFSVGGFALTDRAVQLNGFEYQLTDLMSICFNFHPVRMGDEPGLAVGSMTLVIETKAPHMVIGEKFTRDDEACVAYHINEDSILYRFPRDSNKLAEYVNRAILGWTIDLSEARFDWRASHVTGYHYTENDDPESRTRHDPRKDMEEYTKLETAKHLLGVEQPFFLFLQKFSLI